MTNGVMGIREACWKMGLCGDVINISLGSCSTRSKAARRSFGAAAHLYLPRVSRSSPSQVRIHHGYYYLRLHTTSITHTHTLENTQRAVCSLSASSDLWGFYFRFYLYFLMCVKYCAFLYIIKSVV